MILIITRKDDVHADIVAKKLTDMGEGFFRLNTDSVHLYETTLSTGSMFIRNTVTGNKICLEDIRSVWLRRRSFPEGTNVVAEYKSFMEEEWLNFYRNISCPLKNKFWINHPFAIENAKGKLTQLDVARSVGFLTPDTLYTNSITDLLAFKEKYGKCIYKPHDGGVISSTTDKMVYTNIVPDEFYRNPDTEKRLRICPGIFQPYIEKSYELRVTVVGKQIFATKIDSQKSPRTMVDWRKYDFRNVPHTTEELSTEEELRCVEITKRLGLVFGAIDMIVTPEKMFYFLEINANGQWAWIEALTGQPISREIANLLVQSNDK